MSTPDRPLTRRQLREIRSTGQVPVVSAHEAAEAAQAAVDEAEAEALSVETTEDAVVEEPVDDAAADDAAVDEVPVGDDGAPAEADEHGDDASERPLTRRELREQRMRTSQIAVVDADEDEGDDEVIDESLAPQRAARLAVGFDGAGTAEDEQAEPELVRENTEAAEAPVAEESVLEEIVDEEPAATQSADAAAEAESAAPVDAAVPAEDEVQPSAADEAADAEQTPQVGASFGAAVFLQAEERQRAEREQAEREAAERREAKEQAESAKADDVAPAPSPVVAPVPAPAAEPKSPTGKLAAEAFQHSTESGGSTAGNTSSLILKDMPGTAALNAPITATGELILTSSHTLPAGLGTHGAAHGTTDGKDIDELLLDGEIPQHSSPTPIAASSAVSTSKAPGEVIRPPAPEKNHGLMLTLGITAGVLGVALIGVVVYVFATGALN